MRSVADASTRRGRDTGFDAPSIVAFESMALLLFIIAVWFVTIPIAAALAAMSAARRRL